MRTESIGQKAWLVMPVPGIIGCQIVRRTNRFVVEVELGGRIWPAHINNTGRLDGLLEAGQK
ncbi:MAG: hypothetical protein N3E40_01380, partial [Dehalococcoidia bacterium]|nr:hypothetical protein [Dehalococcoidia bacterium]